VNVTLRSTLTHVTVFFTGEKKYITEVEVAVLVLEEEQKGA
jgi:hypothetical protein